MDAVGSASHCFAHPDSSDLSASSSQRRMGGNDVSGQGRAYEQGHGPPALRPDHADAHAGDRSDRLRGESPACQWSVQHVRHEQTRRDADSA